MELEDVEYFECEDCNELKEIEEGFECIWCHQNICDDCLSDHLYGCATNSEELDTPKGKWGFRCNKCDSIHKTEEEAEECCKGN